MLLDLLSAARVAQPPRRILHQELLDKVRERGSLANELRGLGEDVAERFLTILAFERRLTVEHFVDEYSEGPPVNGELVAVAADDLRRDVLLGADERVGALAVGETQFSSTHRADSRGLGFLEGVGVGLSTVPVEGREGDPAGKVATVFSAGFFELGIGHGHRSKKGFGFEGEFAGEVEIGEGDVAVVLDENIFWFEVTVCYAHRMEMVERAEDFCYVEADDGGGEGVVGLTVAEDVEVAAGTVG